MKFTVEIDKNFRYSIEQKALSEIEVVELSNRLIKVRYHGKNYQFDFMDTSSNYKLQSILYNSRLHHVEILDELDQLVKDMGLDEINENISGDIHSPMPGLVLEIMVSKGQHVKKGDNLLILEAMKMENIIKADGDGVIEDILVVKSDKVDKGQLLVSINS